eukprot:TRINITY_DN3687_c1_g1_i1.p1 TRINITY_DN3687_c1_g1~~TRINITY_DN3687_c1_g1_i1.p1  ORF type:complete len:227 (+),score=63.83 TRINITY_DN3687_c1_g1_i1:46-726(+)
MSFLSKIFGGGGGGSKPATQPPPIKKNNTVETFERMAANIERMEKRQRILEKEITDLEDQAKKFFATRTETGKKRAVGCMKRKKAKEKELMNSLAQVDSLRDVQNKMVEQEHINEQVRIRQEVRDHMNAQKLNVDEIYDVTQDIAEAQKEIQEASEVLATPFADDLEDEDELLAELEGMDADDLAARLDGAEVSNLAPLPAPVENTKEKQKEEDESLLAELGLNLA